MRISRRSAAVLLALYLAFVLTVTLTPLPLEVPPPNLVPLAAIAWLITTKSPLFAATQIAGNLLLLAPLGLLGPAALPWVDRWWRLAGLAAALAVAIELAQLSIPGRHSDIDDVLLNVTGILLALALRSRVAGSRGHSDW